MMNFRSIRATLAGVAGLLLFCPLVAQAQKKSEDVVKATASADKAGADGRQMVTITLEIDPKYYIYANPVGNEDLASNQTTVTIAGKGVKIDYPAGDVKKDKIVGDYRIYKGKVTIKASVERSENGPLDIGVRVQACSDKACLAPGTVKVSVP
jgi:thiol:disulfide interchange protein